jgi:phosphopantothenoylcysteine decarboxylase/phosphopantothenate--cysteine ligase
MSLQIIKDQTILITAGPTREAIDPVRYISNHSSGKMGYAIAAALLRQGARVILVSGPVNIRLQHPNLKLIPVSSANEMLTACCTYFEDIDIAIFAAAVADYRPERVAEKKIKKSGDELLIKLVKNPDIAMEFGKLKRCHQLSIGFALETNDELKHAGEKLRCKNFDMVVLNSMNDAGATFGHDTNKVTIIKKGVAGVNFPIKSKTEVADDIINEIAGVLHHRAQFIKDIMQFLD